MSARPEIRGVTITGTGRCLPPRVVTNFDLEKIVDTSDEWIRERTGISERRFSDPGVNSSDLAREAAEQALTMAGISAEEVDQIIVATTTPDRYLPSCACTVQAKLGAKRAAAYDMFAACTGFVYGMSIARGLIGSGVAETVLVIGVEQLSRIMDLKDRNTCVLFGDGAGAAIFRPCEPGTGILGIDIHSDGNQGELLEIPAGGGALPASHETVDQGGHFIRMKGKELFKVAVRGMYDSMRVALDRSGLTITDIDLVIPHQANKRIIDAVTERLGVPDEKVVLNIDRYGNTSSASIPISLDEVVRSGRVKPGDCIGYVAFGGGVTWGAAVQRWTAPVPVAALKAAPATAEMRA